MSGIPIRLTLSNKFSGLGHPRDEMAAEDLGSFSKTQNIANVFLEILGHLSVPDGCGYGD
jgi:hypothetical protein